jgi:hypothetical protein
VIRSACLLVWVFSINSLFQERNTLVVDNVHAGFVLMFQIDFFIIHRLQLPNPLQQSLPTSIEMEQELFLELAKDSQKFLQTMLLVLQALGRPLEQVW